jgi:phosphomannomutase
MLYYAVGELGLDGGVAVTASHNPKEYTGMKIVRAARPAVGGDSGLLDDVAARARRVVGESRAAARCAEDIWAGFVDSVLSFVDAMRSGRLKVVVDAANGMAGAMLPPVLERLPQLDVVRCFFEPDGPFPNHEPNPLLPENREFIVERHARGRRPRGRVRRRRRPLLLRRRHGRVRPRRLRRRALSRARCSRRSRAQVIYDVRASWAGAARRSRSRAASPLVNRVGHAFIKQRMREEDALFAGEVSAHYYFRDFSQADTGVVPFLADARARLDARPAVGAPRAVPRARTSSPARSTRRADVDDKLRELEERYAVGGRDLAPRRRLVDVRRLALQRAALEHRAAPPLNLEALDERLMERRGTRCST